MTHRLMAIVHARDQLLKEVAGLILGEPSCFDDALKELTTSSILHDDTQVCGSQEHLRRTIQSSERLSTSPNEPLFEPPSGLMLPGYAKLCSHDTDLLEADDVDVVQHAMVDDLPLHVPIDLHATASLSQHGVPWPTSGAGRA